LLYYYSVIHVSPTGKDKTKHFQQPYTYSGRKTDGLITRYNQERTRLTKPTITYISLLLEKLYGTKVPYANTAKYLGMTLDAKLRWKEYIKKKRDEFNIKFRKMYWLFGRNSELSVHNKLYVQFGVMVSSSGAALVNPILK
jgi:hypothetical protein